MEPNGCVLNKISKIHKITAAYNIHSKFIWLELWTLILMSFYFAKTLLANITSQNQ
jgi:hypothetical protein